ncbi:ribosomal protein S5 domain 2-type protein [Ephemerocybe angulata]|uniref:Ribosomal protein S5 domain 2-type protein n=1 Tax=Ephemerocybe angulata TaxID=980116 RepID=A0A8H6MDK3_9AGAR|nr:ribosomal protein S5 domain 2-type protein [Tulosesus angulatus]
MPRTPSPPPVDDNKYVEELQELLSKLSEDPEKEQVASEIEVLQSIYGESAIRLYQSSEGNGEGNKDPDTIRYQVTLSFPPPHEDVAIKILVSLPPTYPSSTSPQLQLLSRYIGAFGVDPGLFGSIIRTYISVSGVQFIEDQPCVFDGLQNVLECCVAWYEEHISLDKAGQLVRDEAREASGSTATASGGTRESGASQAKRKHAEDSAEVVEMPPGIVLHVGEAIQDRKSTFIGRACQITDPSQVPQILSHLMSDRRIARAAHPIINAWRCQVGALLHQDNDDDGETAAGGRLAHLLQILEVNNVLVVVTRYFGGIHLGPDRFKHINQAARNALDVGGFLEVPDSKKHVGRGKKHG